MTIAAFVIVLVILNLWVIYVHSAGYKLGVRHGRQIAALEQRHSDEVLAEVEYRSRVEASIADTSFGPSGGVA